MSLFTVISEQVELTPFVVQVKGQFGLLTLFTQRPQIQSAAVLDGFTSLLSFCFISLFVFDLVLI